MRYNLVLSGGGVRGYAHIGAVQALQELGVEIAAVSGGSSGALVGAFLCDGFAPAEIREFIRKEEPQVNFNFKSFGQGLLSFEGVGNYLQKHLRSRTFEELRIPLFISATDLNTGKQTTFSTGEIFNALRASSAIPLLLPPVEIDGVPYADAGMSNNLPVEPVSGRPEKIIGIHVNSVFPFRRGGGVVETIDRSMHIIVGNNIRTAVSMCDIFIEPPELMNYHILQRKKAMEIIQLGYDYVISHFTKEQLLRGLA